MFVCVFMYVYVHVSVGAANEGGLVVRVLLAVQRVQVQRCEVCVCMYVCIYVCMYVRILYL